MMATDLLEKQHREVATLFRKALKSEKPQEKVQLVGEIAEKLTLHASLEEEIFYPAFREEAGDAQKVEDAVLEAYEEHHVVKILLEELSGADPKAESYDAKLTVLKEIVEHHVEEEEEEMFPAAEKKLGKERLEDLAAEIQTAIGESAEAPARRKAS